MPNKLVKCKPGCAEPVQAYKYQTVAKQKEEEDYGKSGASPAFSKK